MTREEPELVRDFAAVVREHIPGFEIRYKDESRSSKVLGILVWIFNREYMTRYTTTRYPRVYFPSRQFVQDSPMRAFKILAHEFVHLWDTKKQGIWHNIGYGFPQLLAIPFILALIVFSIVPLPMYWKIGTVIASVLGVGISLCPWPAPFRRDHEIRGYTMNLCVNKWRHGGVPSEYTLTWMVRAFSGPAYYFMWRDEHDVKRRLHALYTQIIENDTMDEPYRVTQSFIKERNL